LILRLTNLLLCLLCSMSASAAFVGFPLESNTNTPNWYAAREMYNPISQIYSGIVERCEAVGISSPSIVETWTVSAGVESQVVTNLVWAAGVWNPIATNVYTNIVLLSKSVTTTNQLGAFEYEYTNESCTFTSTGFPYVTRYFMASLDSKLSALESYFTPNFFPYFTNGNYDAWFFDEITTNTDGVINANYNTDLTMSWAQRFADLDIGYHDPVSTNDVGDFNGYYCFTRQPGLPTGFALSETVADTNAQWVFNGIGDFDTRYYAPDKPFVTYTPFGTQSFSSATVTIYGDVLVQSDQSTDTSSEIVTMSSMTQQCTNVWYSITNMVVSAPAALAATGGYFTVHYTNVVLYGTRPYRLFARDLDERAAVLSSMTITDHGGGHSRWYDTVPSPWDYDNQGQAGRAQYLSTNTSWDAVKTIAENNYPSTAIGIAKYGPAMTAQLSEFTTRGARAETYANRLDVTVTTNDTPREIQVYLNAWLRTPSLYNSDPAAMEFDDYGIGLEYGTYKLVGSTTNETYSQSWGSENFPSWPTATPTASHPLYIRGFEITSYNVYAVWDFEYK